MGGEPTISNDASAKRKRSYRGVFPWEILDEEKLTGKIQNRGGSSTLKSPDQENDDPRMVISEMQNSMFGQGKK